MHGSLLGREARPRGRVVGYGRCCLLVAGGGSVPGEGGKLWGVSAARGGVRFVVESGWEGGDLED